MINKNKGWIGVDLDGTLAHYDGWRGETHIGAPIVPMVNRVKQWIADGIEVRIFTARISGSENGETGIRRIQDAIHAWCLENLGCYIGITNIKDYAMIELWDDRAIQVIPNTGLRADGKDS